MAVVIESEIWQPHASVFAIILLACFLSVTLLPHFSNHRSSISGSSQSPFDVGFGGYSASFLRFKRKFLLYYSIGSVMEGLWSVFGDYEAEKLGFGRETIVLSLGSGFLVALCAVGWLGIASDMMGQKRFCILFCILHVIAGIWKKFVPHPTIWIANLCLTLGGAIFSFSFETWMVLEHEKL